MTDTSDISGLAAARPSYLTVKQAVALYPGMFPTERALRNLIFKADDHHYSRGIVKGNGLGSTIIRLGRKVLLDEAKLIEWVESHRKGGNTHA